MSDGMIVGLVAAGVTLAGIVSPVIVGMMVNNAGRKMKTLDWEREDVVSARAEAAALRAQETQAALVHASEAQTGQIKAIEGKVDIIHGLTNSALTAVKKSELAALIGQLAAQEALAEIRPNAKQGDLQVLRDRVDALTAELAERERQDEVAVEKARQMSAEHSAAEMQQSAALDQQEAAKLQTIAADKQIVVAQAQAMVADAQAEANRTNEPEVPNDR